MARPAHPVSNRHYAIPENLDLDGLVAKHPPRFKGKSKFRADRACDVLDTLYRQAVRHKVRSDTAFIPVPSTLFQRIVSDYHEYIAWFERCAVIEVDHRYVPSAVAGGTGRCKAYRFAPDYRTPATAWTPASDALSPVATMSTTAGSPPDVGLFEDDAVVSPEPDECPLFPVPSLAPPHLAHIVRKTPAVADPHNANTLARLSAVLERVRVQPAYEDELWAGGERSAIENNGMAVYLMDIARRQAWTSISPRTGRLYTPITQMRGMARRFLTLDGCDDLSIVDVRTCHPYLMIRVAKQARSRDGAFISGEEIDEWTNVILDNEHDLYEHLVCAYAEAFAAVQTREHWKECVQRIFNGRIGQTHYPDGRPFREKEVFECLFPAIMRVIDHVKRTPTVETARLSLRLQQLEAEVMLWKICPRLLNAGVDVLTVHDAVIVPTERVEDAQRAIAEEFERVVGVAPRTKCARLSDVGHATPKPPWLPPQIAAFYEGPEAWAPVPVASRSP